MDSEQKFDSVRHLPQAAACYSKIGGKRPATHETPAFYIIRSERQLMEQLN
jgi:hypothetical protein